MDYNIDNEHFNATFKASVRARALLTLPEDTLKAIVKQQGNDATAGTIKILFEEANCLMKPGECRWMESQKGFKDHPWAQGEEAADRMFPELRLLSELPTGPQRVFDLLFIEVPDIGNQWICCVDQEAPWYWYKLLDDLMHHMIQQQYKQKATSPEAWDPLPWIEQLQKFRAHVQDKWAMPEYEEHLETVFEKSLRELLG